jgi:nicotinate-nucleotide--dimethylbenzimidazole phosphoribosyltransferase
MNIPIFAPDRTIETVITDHINHKTKPLGALGQLESIALSIGLIQQTVTPSLIEPTILVFAGDHGIANSGVSAYPQAVTAQMVLNFLNGGAAINVFTKQNNLHFKLVDSGVNYLFESSMHLTHAKIGLGTQNFLFEPAMSVFACNAALLKGAEIMQDQVNLGCNVVGFGEMGIGNTASASCLLSVMAGLPIELCVGRGTGLDDAGLIKKIDLLSQAISLYQLSNRDVIDEILATFGGFEIAMMVGAMLKAAEQKCILIIDGFIVTVALLVASKIEPNILHYCIFSHCSDESAHAKLLDLLNAKPLLNLGLRLGEGTGAALAYPLIQASVNFMNEMASFESANVSHKK